MGALSDTSYTDKVDTELHMKDDRINIIRNLGDETGTKSYAMQ